MGGRSKIYSDFSVFLRSCAHVGVGVREARILRATHSENGQRALALLDEFFHLLFVVLLLEVSHFRWRNLEAEISCLDSGNPGVVGKEYEIEP